MTEEPPRVRPSNAVHHRFANQRRTGTRPELLLRRELHRRDRRFRVHCRIDGLPRRRVDLAFTRWRLVVLVDGCFWHGCPAHGVLPSTNADWWRWKLDLNARRDADTDARLADLGWRVLRIWEHVDPREAADKVEDVLRELGAPQRRTSAGDDSAAPMPSTTP